MGGKLASCAELELVEKVRERHSFIHDNCCFMMNVKNGGEDLQVLVEKKDLCLRRVAIDNPVGNSV